MPLIPARRKWWSYFLLEPKIRSERRNDDMLTQILLAVALVPVMIAAAGLLVSLAFYAVVGTLFTGIGMGCGYIKK
jgi:uncharacterized membrane-anchored protein YitT (DUF2179 family)